jgi:hypothetical protein
MLWHPSDAVLWHISSLFPLGQLIVSFRHRGQEAFSDDWKLDCIALDKHRDKET